MRFSSPDPFLTLDSRRSDMQVGEYNGKSWGFEPSPGDVGVSPRFRTVVPRNRRLLYFLGLSVFISTVLIGRLVQLQVAQGAELREAAEENRIRIEPIIATRGIMYDRNGVPLVQNVPNMTLQATSADLPDTDNLDEAARILSEVLHEDESALSTELKELHEDFSYTPSVFRDHLSYDTAMRLKLVEGRLPGFRLIVSPAREYLHGAAFSHVLGYTGNISEEELANVSDEYLRTDEIGKSGIEQAFEQLLRGVYGKKRIEVDSRGKEKRVVASEEPIQGSSLRLTLRADVQQQAYDSLMRMLDSTGSKGGSAVAIDPRSGELLALVSAPAYDNNIFVNGSLREEYPKLLEDPRTPLLFRPLSGQYPPGSTIKPLVGAIALEEGIISERTTVQSNGGIRINEWFFPDWRPGGHGSTDIKKAIADSVNTFFYMVGGGYEEFNGLGITKMRERLAQFGFGAETGLAIRGEAKGFLPSPEWKKEAKNEQWYIGDTYHASIGQGDILVTPLQMAVATSAIANGGALITPRLVHATKNAENAEEVISTQVVNEQVVAQKNATIIQEAMRQTVTGGSARSLANFPVPVSAKTGTAQFGNQGKTHAWFTSFAPSTSPEIVVVVMVEGGGEGHAAALPVARDILSAYFAK